MLDIIGIDSSVVDYIISIDRLPRRDEEIEMYQQSWQGGGEVATALAAASRLGARCGLMGKNGDDANGDFIVRDMKKHGVDMSHFIQEKNTAADYCLSLAEKEGGRSFIVKWGDHHSFDKSELDYDYIKQAKCVHLSSRFEEADICMAAYAKEHGAVIGFDGDEYKENIEKHIGLIDIFIGSEFCYRDWFKGRGSREENCRKIQKRGPEIVIFTFGTKGCAGVDENGEYFELPVFPVKAVDTTGAGDVFHGAFLFFRVCRKMPAKEAARYASAVSAIKCTRLGGRSGIPTLDMTEDFVKTGTYDDSELAQREAEYSKLLCL